MKALKRASSLETPGYNIYMKLTWPHSALKPQGRGLIRKEWNMINQNDIIDGCVFLSPTAIVMFTVVILQQAIYSQASQYHRSWKGVLNFMRLFLF